MAGLVRRMNMMQDIKTEEDIKILVDSFYDKVRQDGVIGFIFNEIIGADWSHHLPIMYRFWNMVLLNRQGYVGNPIAKHVSLDKRIPLQEEHYEKWLQLWEETVDTLFAGEIANNAKEKARLMLQLIATKVNLARDGKSIL